MAAEPPAIPRRRVVAFAGIAGGCLVLALVAILSAALKTRHQQNAADRLVASDRKAVLALLDSGRPYVLFRSIDRYHPARTGRLAIAPIVDGRPGRSLVAGPACQRVGWAAGHGLCLTPPGPQGFNALVLDGRLDVIHRLHLSGNPSRARVSPNGRLGAVTSFVVGDSYTTPGRFSTRTTLIDLRRGRAIADLERFAITRAGRRITARDVNFWGVTFAADNDTFYATLATGGRTYLVRASVRARRGETIHENVECPSLSPDGKLIGYKKAVIQSANAVWRFTVLNLATKAETPLSETQSIDDQIAWLDNDHVLYAEGDTTWSARADGAGRPEAWLTGGASPQVSRGG